MHAADLKRREDRILGHILRSQADAIPDATYLRVDDERYSYGRVNALANAVAHGLRALGVSRGDTVAVLMESCPEFVFTAYGANKLGAIWVPTNVDYKGAWLRDALEGSRARLLLCDAALLPRVAELGAGLPFEHIVVRGACAKRSLEGVPIVPFEELLAAPTAEPDDPDLSYGDTAAVLWTSGTTGRAKGVMQSHNAWIRGAEIGAHNSGVREGDALYCCLPMYNSAAWVTAVYRALVTGIPMGLDARFSVASFWDRCRHYDATMIFTLGASHIFLWQAPERPDDADNPVRAASMVPLPDELIEPMRRRFGFETLDQGYGQSECMGLFFRMDDGVQRWKPRSLGAPVPGLEIALLDDDDRPVPTGEPGELSVRPTEPHVIFNGYFNDPDATVRAYRNLWYHTGDLARRDEDGEYFFVDRKADFIRFKGRNVSSFAVEGAVGSHPAVKECAAHGVTSAELDSEAEIKVVGVVLHELQDLPAAKREFEEALRLDPGLQDEAEYRLGLIALAQDDTDTARRFFESVGSRDPSSPLARSSDTFIRSLEGQDPRFRLYGKIGVGYDDNVNLAGAGDELRGGTGENGDIFGFAEGGGELELFENDRFLLRAGGTGYLSIHGEEEDFDLEALRVWTQATAKLGPRVRADLRYTYGQVWADFDGFRRSHIIEPAVRVRTGGQWLSRVFYRYWDRQFSNSTPIDSLDRDGQVSHAGFDQYRFFLNPFGSGPGFARLGYRRRIEHAQGEDYDSRGDEIVATFGTSLPWDLYLTADARFEWRHFSSDNALDKFNFGLSSRPQGHREDKILWTRLLLEKTISERLVVEVVAYRFVNRASNIEFYDYDRHIVHAAITFWY